MASVDVEIGSRRYTIACRDGEEAHLRSVAELVDKRAHDALQALGSLGEARQLLFASLLLADDLKEARSARAGQNEDAAGTATAQSPEPAGPAPAASLDPALLDALEGLAARIEALAESLETRADTP